MLDSNPLLPSARSREELAAASDAVRHAYHLVQSYVPESAVDLDKTKVVLKALLDHAPSTAGRENIAAEVAGTSTTIAGLKGLADYYLSSFLVPLLTTGGRTPQPTSYPSRDDDDADDLSQRRSRTLKKELLSRDNGRCVLSGIHDVDQWYALFPDERDETEATDFTETAHVVPFSLAESEENQSCGRAKFWDALHHIFPEIKEQISSHLINDPSNAFTLITNLHKSFGKFLFCLVPTNTPNHYRIQTFRRFPKTHASVLPASREITFVTHDGRYPLPNPNLLKLHAAVANMLSASGMAEFLEKLFHDWNELKCLSGDGSTSLTMLLVF